MGKFLCKFILVCWLIVSCQSDNKYIGYNYDADSYQDTVNVSGQITNIFTDQPVDRAYIVIPDRAGTGAFSNSLGEYETSFTLLEDNLQGRKIPIEISADDYHGIETDTVLFPGATVLDFKLEFGRPTVQATTCSAMTFCQAIIHDYQGVDNIKFVIATFDYVDSSGFYLYQEQWPLVQVDVISESVAYYERVIEPYDQDSNAVSPTYGISVEDHDGFSTYREHNNNLFNPDTLLFPVYSDTTGGGGT